MNPQRQPGGQIIDLQQTPSNRVLTGKYRRNGKLQSCEPCRRSKLRCDHVIPACGRCVKRRCVDRCSYHPSPLTRTRRKDETAPPTPLTPTHDGSSVIAVQSVETSSVKSPNISASHTPRLRSTDIWARGAHRAASAPPLHIRDEPTSRTGNRGFLGETSYFSIFADGLGNFAIPSDPEPSKVWLSHDRIAQGCKILSFLKDGSMVNRLVARWYQICEDEGCVCIEPIMKEWLWGLGLHHGDVLREQNPDKIRRLCELLWRNTETPLSLDKNITAAQWARQGTGPHLRWEVVGLIAAIAGQCANTPDPAIGPFRKRNFATPSFARQMSEIAEACIGFCRDCETMGDMFLWLLMENYCLTAMLKGESSQASYVQCGEIVTAVVSVGLHQGVQADDQLPIFISEIRKRLLVQTYSAEIGIATFLGRPPRISHRYCNFQSPLDLSISQLVSEGDELALALAGLDDKGFNTAGNIYRVTWVKTWMGLAPEREDVLDLAVGRYTRDEILQRADLIQSRSEQYWDSLPNFIKKLRDGPLETEGKKSTEILFMTVLRQAFRANDLLLQRVLIRKAGASSERLVDIARSTFKDILHMSQRHDLGALLQNDMASLLAVQGLRSAAVIAVELLKQEQFPVYPKEPLVPRSQTIQDLAVFAARLGAIDPTDGSFLLCDQGRRVITYILDKILTPQGVPDQPLPPRVPSLTQPDEQQQLGPVSLDTNIDASVPTGLNPLGTMDFTMMDLNFGIEAPFLGPDNDFMQWLENMDWERPIPWDGGGQNVPS
ncbi:hypothetical protein GGS23DRAFT_618267 [Durotheca rogersii]|uniref:uncharacterized protein n=1 Tax=Durotheca rogersii TaxID=419775 RepID=UPI002220D3B5|nr:uncharacterized protein GGS23DRAFT_618267 [Durotheca rogersii]KAI5865270.1 hypothetical protein GGS23DRAFT_618267 [Durotheca rogersii]